MRILVHQRETHRQLAHRRHAQAQNGVVDRNYRPARPHDRIRLSEQATGEGRIGLDHPGHFIQARIVATTDLHDGQRDALGAGELATESQLFNAVHGQILTRCDLASGDARARSFGPLGSTCEPSWPTTRRGAGGSIDARAPSSVTSRLVRNIL